MKKGILIIFMFLALVRGLNRMSGTIDVALFKSATQSSTYGNKSASYAVDGNISTCAVTGIGSHSNAFAWWQVDLGMTYDVKFVVVKNTLDPYEYQYLSNFDVLVGLTNSTDQNASINSLCCSYPESSTTGQKLILQCSSGISSIGRFVTIKRFGGFQSDALALCDVKILVELSKDEHITDPGSTAVTLKLINTNPKLATQSSTFSNFGADLALDRNNETCSIAGVGSESREFGWWMIDLNLTANVTSISIFNSKNYYESMFLSQFDVFIDSRPLEFSEKCASLTGKTQVAMGSFVTLNCNNGGTLGRYVSIKRFGGFRQDALSICEVYIYGLLANSETYVSPVLPKNIKPISWLESSIFSTYTVDLAFDGDLNTCFVIGEGSGSQNYAWLILDLGATYMIESIIVTNHYSYYEASFFNELEVSVATILQTDQQICSVFSKVEPANIGEKVRFTCKSSNAFGRYVTFRRLGGFRQDAFAACEIEIWALDMILANSSESIPVRNISTTPQIISSITTIPFLSNSNIHSTLTPFLLSTQMEISTKTSMSFSTTTSTMTSSTMIMVCPDRHVKCISSNMCIPENNLCDNWNDCGDFSDEMNCECLLLDRFRCENSKCIDPAWICDKDDDCEDGSDEKLCNCSASEFKCNNGKCVKLSEKCNGFDNCGDESDEDQCGKTCSPMDFDCDSGHCINSLDVCNSQFDCEDQSDELNCDCWNGYKCNLTGQCVAQNQICDRIRHCPDNSDEINCVCLDFQYKCQNGPCITKDWLCDGINDCPFGDDEEDACTRCMPDQFVCLNRRICLEQNQVCNGINECSNDEDENRCLVLEGNENSTTMKPLKLIMNNKEHYICSELWSDVWSTLSCSYLGIGFPKGISFANISSPSLFVALKNAVPNINVTAFVNLFVEIVACPSNMIVLLECSEIPSPNCGLRSLLETDSSNNLVNADVAPKGAWPWHVQIFVNNKFECGGTLTSREWVLTAAHCFDNLGDNSASFVFIIMGTDILENGLINISKFIEENKNNPEIQYSKVEKIIINPKYEDFSVIYDVALVKLSSPATWTDLVRPVCLPSLVTPIMVSHYQVCYAIGHGDTYPNSNFSRFLLQGRMDIIDFDTCIKDISNKTKYNVNYLDRNIDRNAMFCAGSQPSTYSTFTCRGDSGSPLICLDMSQRWIVLGLSSFTFESMYSQCENSIYANVSTVLDWIIVNLDDNV